MSFSTADFKKTSRKVGDKRVLYPHQLRDDRYLAAISYAVDYYERMAGRPRREMQADTLLEFFGDPKLARGIVACLGRTYLWHQPDVSEVVDAETYAALRDLGLDRPSAVRQHLYRYVNAHHNGFLPSVGRATVLEALCADLPIDRRTFETLLTLDAAENAILTKVAGMPSARDIVALYNYHSIETALRSSSALRLTLNGPIWTIVRTVHNISKRYNLRYTIEHGAGGLFAGTVTIEWVGKRDVLGGYSRYGRRVVRALLRLLAAHPDAPVEGEATVHLAGTVYSYTLNKAVLSILGVQAQRVGRGDEAWEAAGAAKLLNTWNKAYLRGETGGWRLRRDPEPLISEAGVIVPDFLIMRGQQRAYLVLADSRTTVEALVKPLRALNGRVLIIVATEAEWSKLLAALPSIVVPHVGEPSARMLARALPSPTVLAQLGESKWQRLERLLDTEGFVDEARLADILHCSVPDVAGAVRGWRTDRASYLPGIGLCSDETVQDIRALLQSGIARQAA
jgi:predicted nuclease of restriction endonuclease-like RecB superfamily